MSKSNLRVAVRLVALFSLVFALSLAPGWASSLTNIGSSLSDAGSILDTSAGQVSIYDGGFFSSGETITTFNWFGPSFTGSRELTPLILTESGGVFTVVGIGAPETVTYTGSMQSFAFGLIAGTDVTTAGNFTFGFISGLVNSDGTLSGTSTGSIGLNLTVDAGTGIQGSGTNDWVFTPSLANITVGLGTTFEIPGSDAELGSPNFLLNSGTAPRTDRTYLANADGTLSGVAEPGTFSLITGAGLVLAGLFRYRYTRGRRS